MPPKKKVEVKKVMLGRPRNTLKMGLVGLPNVGKSTTFNCLSNLNVPAENYPFCTIDPAEAKIFVHDPRFENLCQMYKPKSMVSASISIFDIAGLVKGASEGAGLGNAFLSHIDAVDGIYHVVRAFDNEEVIHDMGDVDPIRDMEVITDELFAKDKQKLAKIKAPIQLQIDRKNDRNAKDEMAILVKVEEMLNARQPIRDGTWLTKEIEFLNTLLFLTAKPVVYIINIGYEEYKKKKNKWLPKIAGWIKENGGGPMIPFSAEFEKEVLSNAGSIKKEDRDSAADQLGAPSMMAKIVNAGYNHLHLIHYFTAGADEVKCWTIRDGTKAPQAAGVIHTDFERGFICAEIMAYDDLVEHGSEAGVKAEGKYHQKGKDYEVQDGDIIYFKFNVTAQPKKIDKAEGKK